jgi:uncharacterized protein
MKQLPVFLILIVVVTSGYSQQQSNDIIVEGTAKMKVKPDVATFTLTIEKRDTSEKRAINKLNIAVDGLEKVLNKIGFANRAIRISDYDVSGSLNEQNNRKTYMATNILKLEFAIDRKLIDAMYTQIQQAGIQDLDIEFDSNLSDSLEKQSRLELVQRSIEDAKQNAANIAKYLEIKLGRVKQVQKSAGASNLLHVEFNKFTPPKIVGDTELKYKTSFDKFEIEDIELEETIALIYTIATS